MPIKNNINFGYHAHGPTFAFFKEYLESNKHDDQAELGEESMFTHNFTSPLIQLNPLKTVLVMCHQQNTVKKQKR